MNGQKIVELMLDGGYLQVDYVEGSKFFHPSFRKGWRKLQQSDISFQAALRKLGSQVKYENKKYFL
jgi:hypothetical protein